MNEEMMFDLLVDEQNEEIAKARRQRRKPQVYTMPLRQVARLAAQGYTVTKGGQIINWPRKSVPVEVNG